jgi:hypothetical protein
MTLTICVPFLYASIPCYESESQPLITGQAASLRKLLRLNRHARSNSFNHYLNHYTLYTGSAVNGKKIDAIGKVINFSDLFFIDHFWEFIGHFQDFIDHF